MNCRRLRDLAIAASLWAVTPLVQAQPKLKETIILKLQPELKAANLILRIDSKPYGLAEQITIENADRDQEHDIELVDSHGRVVDYQFRSLDEQMLRDFHPRALRINAFAGQSLSSKNAWEKAFLDSRQMLVGFEANYQPSQFGLILGIQRISDSGSEKIGPLVSYRAVHSHFGGSFEFAPLPSHTSWWRYLLCRLSLSYSWGTHVVLERSEELFENEQGDPRAITKEDRHETKTKGALISIEGRYPLVDNVWLGLRAETRHEHVKLKNLGINTKVPQRMVSALVSIGW